MEQNYNVSMCKKCSLLALLVNDTANDAMTCIIQMCKEDIFFCHSESNIGKKKSKIKLSGKKWLVNDQTCRSGKG